MDANTPQLRLNPTTGEWEELTSRQWWLLKVGLPKTATIDDWTLAILKGPEYAVQYAFGKNQWDNPGANKWLCDRYREWFPKNPRPLDFAQWAYFITDVYNLDKILPLMDELYKLKIGILKNSIESLKLEKSIQEKKDRFYAKNFERKRR